MEFKITVTRYIISSGLKETGQVEWIYIKGVFIRMSYRLESGLSNHACLQMESSSCSVQETGWLNCFLVYVGGSNTSKEMPQPQYWYTFQRELGRTCKIRKLPSFPIITSGMAQIYVGSYDLIWSRYMVGHPSQIIQSRKILHMCVWMILVESRCSPVDNKV